MSFYITTPIYYVNAQPHLGHAYSTIVADTINRFKGLGGEDSRFQTGTDEHGDKIVTAATEAGLSPEEYVNQISALFRQAWPLLSIEPDNFIRTTEPAHVRTVQAILRKVYDQGDIYYGSYSGHYCTGCERFLTDKELVDNKCPDHQVEPALITEQNYFFRMSKYQEWLREHIEKNPEFITPERYRNEVLSFLNEPLEDLCISRPTSRLTWGIPLPFDDRFVTYVWFDALINYLTGIGYPAGPDFARYWQNAEHIIAKDILKPHAIYWPTMLRAMGLEPYRRLHVHGYWNVDKTKMSKSIGNVVRPGKLVEQYGADTVRYFILREMSFGLDASFSTTALEARRNSDLANDLGNLFSRSLTMLDKFAGARVPRPGTANDADRELIEATLTMLDDYTVEMNNFAFNRALQEIWKVISLANRYIVANAPWELAKEEAQAERLATVLYNLAETLRLITLVLQPVMPGTCARMGAALGVTIPQMLKDHDRWGILQPGTATTIGPALFPRLAETKKGDDHGKNQMKEAKPMTAEGKAPVDYEDFKKLDLRVAEVVAAERIKKSDRLLKLTVKAPEERTIVAGLAEHYRPEEMIGRQVIIVANLKAVKLMGVESHGMVLAARSGDALILAAPAAEAKPGSSVA